MTDEEQTDLVIKSSDAIIAIAEKYELKDRNGLAALTEAVQTGLVIASAEMKKVQRAIIVGKI